MLATMWRCGPRMAETLALTESDIGHDAVLAIQYGKGDKTRHVKMDDQTIALLDLWLQARREMGYNGKQRLFCTLKGDEMEQAYVRKLLHRLAVKTGIDLSERRMHPHALRHAYARGLLRDGWSMPSIQQALGHTSLATTGRYLAEIAPAGEDQPARSWEL
jgi:site-specific recombinase XerD